MNFRNKYLLTTVRVLAGLFFIMSGVGGLMFIVSGSSEGVPPNLIPVMQALTDSGIMHMIKVTEIIAGLMLVVGVLPALAAIFVAPICVGAIIVHLCTSPDSVGAAIVLTVANIYFGYAYWDKYKQLFSRK